MIMHFVDKSGLPQEDRVRKCKELRDRFLYRPPFGNQAQRYEAIRSMVGILAIGLFDKCPESREKEITYEKLDEVVYWANASIARNEKQDKEVECQPGRTTNEK